MTQVGYPDFQEQAQWQSLTMVDDNQVLGAGQSITYPIGVPTSLAVSQWQTTQLYVSNGNRIIDGQLTWYADAALASTMGRKQFSLPKNCECVVSFANAGPFVTINLFNGSAGASTIFVRVTGTNRAQTPFNPPGQFPMVLVPVTSIAAGANLDTDATQFYAGPALMSVSTDSNGNWEVIMQGLTSNGTQVEYAWGGPRNVAGPQGTAIPIQVHPLAGRLRIHNYGAAAQLFVAAVVPDYFH